MKIEFNKVTNFSRICAVIVLVALPFWGFYVGYEYGSAGAPPAAGESYTLANAAPVMSYQTASGTVVYAPFEPKHYETSFYRKGVGPLYTYSFSYPRDFDLSAQNPAGGYLTNAAQVSVSTPADAFQNPKSNFGSASLTVSVTSSVPAVAGCYNMPPGVSGKPAATSTAMVNGISFETAATTDVGAGQIYDSRIYRTIFNGFCFEAALTVHTGNIGMYTPGAVVPFDQEKAFSLLEAVFDSFQLSTSTLP